MGQEAEVSDVERHIRRLGATMRAELATRDVVPAVVDRLARDRAVRDARPPRRVRRLAAAVTVGLAVLAGEAWALTSVVFDGGAVTVRRGPTPGSTVPAVTRADLGERIS